MGFKLRSGNSGPFKMMGSSAFKDEDDKPEKPEKPDKPEKKVIDKPEKKVIDEPTVPDPDRQDAGFGEGENIKGSGYQHTAKEKPDVVEIKKGVSDVESKDPNREFIGTDKEVKTGVTSKMLKDIGQERRSDQQFTGQKLDAYGDPLIEGHVGDVSRTLTGRQGTHGITEDGKNKKIIEGLGDKSQLVSKEVTKDGLDRERDKTKLKERKGGIYIDPDTGETKFKKDAYVTKTGEGFLGLQKRKKYIDGKEVTKEYKKNIKEAKKVYKKKKRADKKINKQKKQASKKNPQLVPNPKGGWMKNPNYIS
tara:strand:- start:15496 stop:16416 length:921 start_codon:yes stop_codon:yes gene_type:complete